MAESPLTLEHVIIIIIIIKKVKIIVTLSIKNTAGALYKTRSNQETCKNYPRDIC